MTFAVFKGIVPQLHTKMAIACVYTDLRKDVEFVLQQSPHILEHRVPFSVTKEGGRYLHNDEEPLWFLLTCDF